MSMWRRRATALQLMRVKLLNLGNMSLKQFCALQIILKLLDIFQMILDYWRKHFLKEE
ncbi:hypothetical protein ALP55_200065 [Pseudomonas coronafaciens pv. oryzae]|nr:hypothetical protein ALP55_200065 [Pseudomonas coronafaciens pv. oryzae]